MGCKWGGVFHGMDMLSRIEISAHIMLFDKCSECSLPPEVSGKCMAAFTITPNLSTFML